MKSKVEKRKQVQPQLVRIFTDGAGARPDGKGSGYAWIREDTGAKEVKRQDGLTNNQAEYFAVLAAIEALPNHASAEVITDSDLVANQFNGSFKITSPKLLELLSRIREVITSKKLNLTVSWVPREQNVAGKLL